MLFHVRKFIVEFIIGEKKNGTTGRKKLKNPYMKSLKPSFHLKTETPPLEILILNRNATIRCCLKSEKVL